MRPGDQVDAGGDHRRRMDQCADRRRALHRVGEPGMERNLRGLRDGAAEQAERDENGHRAARLERLLGTGEDRAELEAADVLDDQEEREHERRIAEGVDDERLLAGGDCALAPPPEVDQQVRREPDHAPAGEQEEEVPRHDEQEHREDEQRLVGVVAALLLVAADVAGGVGEDEEADAGDDQHHEHRELVDVDVETGREAPGVQPRPQRRGMCALLRALAEKGREDDRRADEGDQYRAGRNEPGLTPAHPVPGRGQERDRAGRCEQRDPGGGDHAPVSPSSCRGGRRRARRACGTWRR